MLSIRFRRFWVLCVVVGLLTAVFTLSAQATPPRQEDRPSRTNIEDIPYYPLAETPEVQYQIAAAQVVPSSRVVFQSYRDGNWNIYVGNDDGTGQTAVANHAMPDIHPHLNRGNSAIIYATGADEHDYELYRMNADGNNKVALTNNEADDVNPQWSPDGSRIAFESYRDGQAEIYVMNADGSNQIRLTAHGEYDGTPSWSPDGSKIVFSSKRTGSYNIWVMNADGSGLMQLSTQPFSHRPHWSPDGSTIAYDADGNNDGWQELWLMNADGSNQRVRHYYSSNTDIWVGSWSPDGRYIAFTTIHFINYQGNWYWDYAYQDAITISGSSNTIRLSQNNRDWYPRWQTNDIQRPVSQVTTLVPSAPSPIPVRWSGSDPGGAGLKSYDVQVKVGMNGTWNTWLTDTAATSGAYPGVGGQTYYFRSRARDNAFNTEAWPANADSFTTVENLPPHSSLSPLPAYSRLEEVPVINWSGSDPGGSGIATYDVQYSTDAGNWWVDWKTVTTENSFPFYYAVIGQTYEFRVRATDKAQNNGDWSGSVDSTQTTFYTWGVNGIAHDNAGAPISGISMTTSPSPLAVTSNNRDGGYGAYITETVSTYNAAWQKNGYGTLPATEFQGEIGGFVSHDGYLDVFLPPADNLMQNWGFESGSFDDGDWKSMGIGTAVVTSDTQHTGEYAARLGSSSLFEPAQVASSGTLWARNSHLTIDSNNTLHMVWRSTPNNQSLLYYAQKPQNGTWSSPEHIASNSYPGMQLITDTNGRLHLIWMAYQNGDDYVYYSQKNTNGTWSTPIEIGSHTAEYGLRADMDANGVIHVVWPDENSQVTYAQRSTAGIWSSPKIIGKVNYYSQDSIQMAVNNNGIVHVVWQKRLEEYSNLEKINYIRRNIDGTWTPIQIINPTNIWSAMAPQVLVDSVGIAHVFWLQNEEPNGGLYYTHSIGNGWTIPIRVTDIQSYIPYTVLTDVNDSIHLVWSARKPLDNSIQDVFYKTRNSNGHWSEIQNLSSNLSDSSSNPRLAVDSTGLPYVVWISGFYKEGTSRVYYSQGNANGVWTLSQNASGNVQSTDSAISVDSFGNPHITWEDNLYSTSTGLINYTTQMKAEETGDTAVSQMITVPVTMTNPTLSFLYQLTGSSSTYGTGFNVEVDDGYAVTNLFTNHEDADWKHEWISLVEWIGKPITLTFRLHQEVNAPLLNTYLDEVTVGSSYPDVGVDVNDKTAPRGELTTSTLTYNNRGGALASGVMLTYTLPAEMTYVSANIPPVSTNPLVWHLPDMPAKSAPFEIMVTARVNANAPAFTTLTSTAVITTNDTELELLNNQAEGHIYTAVYTYLPLVLR